jgi:hypothetical protein
MYILIHYFVFRLVGMAKGKDWFKKIVKNITKIMIPLINLIY